MASKLSLTSTLTEEELAKALAVAAIHYGVAEAVQRRLTKAHALAHIPDPVEGPWPDPRQQPIEDWATALAEGAVQEWVDGQMRWARWNWTPEPLQIPPPSRLRDVWWLLALGLVGLPLLVQLDVSMTAGAAWLDGVGPAWADNHPGRLPPLPRGQWPPSSWDALQDIATRLTRWADQLTGTVREGWAQGRRLGMTAKEARRGIAEHFTGWSQDFARLVRTELAASWHNATLATTTAEYGIVKAIPGACPDCVRLLEGKTFRLYKSRPANAQAEALTAFWPDKWLENWSQPKSAWVPAIPLHPNCRHHLTPLRKKGS